MDYSEVNPTAVRLLAVGIKLSIRTRHHIAHLTRALGPHCTPPDRRASGGTAPWSAGRTWQPFCWLPLGRWRRPSVKMSCRPFRMREPGKGGRVCVCVVDWCDGLATRDCGTGDDSGQWSGDLTHKTDAHTGKLE